MRRVPTYPVPPVINTLRATGRMFSRGYKNRTGTTDRLQGSASESQSSHRSRRLSGRELTADQADKFARVRHAPRTLLRVDLFAIDEDVQRARRPCTYSSWKAQFTFNIVLEAHGLCFDFASNKTAFDLYVHTGILSLNPAAIACPFAAIPNYRPPSSLHTPREPAH